MAKNTVIVSILGDSKGLRSELNGATGALGKFGKAAAVAGGLAVAALGVVGAKAIKSASELQQNLGAMDSVFKDSAAQMRKWANGAASAVGLAKSEYAGLATVLGAQLKNMGVAQAQLGTQTNKLIGLGADLAAQFGGSTSEAVAALSSLLRGERDPIERYGVSINEAAVKAKLMEMGLSGLTGEAEKNAKLSATLALLYAQTADAQGAFSRESDTLAGAQQRLSAGIENLSATLGTSLLPAATAATSAMGALINKIQESDGFAAFTAKLTEASNSFADFVYKLQNGSGSIDFGSLFGNITTALTSSIRGAAAWISGGGLTPIIESLTNARDGFLGAALELFTAIGEALPVILPQIVEGLIVLINELVTFIVGALPSLLSAAIQLFTGLVEALPVILPQLIAGLVDLILQLLPQLIALLPMIVQAAVTLFTGLIEALPVILPELIAGVVGLIPVVIMSLLQQSVLLLDAAVQLFTALVSSIPLVLPLIITKLIEIAPQLVRTIISMIPQLLASGKQLFTSLVQAIPTIAGSLNGEITKLGPRMFQAVMSLGPQLFSAGGDLIRGLANGIRNGGSAVVNNLLSIARNAISQFKSFLGIHSPSRLFAQFGGFITQGLAGGITRTVGTVKQAVGGLNEAVTGSFNATLDANAPTAPASQSGGTTVIHRYEITVNAIASGVETGRAIVEAIEDYERVTGRTRLA